MAYIKKFNFEDMDSHIVSDDEIKRLKEYEMKHSMLAQQKHTIKVEHESEEEKWRKTMEEFFKKGEELNARKRFKVSNRHVNK